MSHLDNKLNILIAYPYFTKNMLNTVKRLFPTKDEYRLIVDSGAFSAHNAGMTVSLDEYCKFLDMLKTQDLAIEGCIQLDVIFDGEETRANYKKMVEMGYDPCPIFTRGDDEEYFLELINSDKYVFVGGVQRGINNRNFAKWILEQSKGKKVHLLAFIKPDFLNHYKPYSVDASSWSSTARYGTIGFFNNGRIKIINKSDFAKPPKKNFLDSCEKLKIPAHAIRKLRFNESWSSFGALDFSITADVPVRGIAQFINTIHWVYYSIMAQNKIDTKIYLAISQSLHLEVVRGAYDHLKRNGVI